MKKGLKSLLVIASVLAIAFAFTACGGSSSDTYKAALEPTFPPFDTTDEDSGELTGFDVDLVNAIGEDQGFAVEWENVGFDGLIPALQADSVNIVASGMTITDERAEEVDFTDSYWDAGLVVAVKNDEENVKSIDDLTKDMIVGAQIGTTGANKAQELEKKGKIKEAKIYNGVDTAMADLMNGTIAAVINDKPVTEAYIAKNEGKIKTVGEVIDAESYGIAVKKGNTELLDKMNAGLKNLKDNGKFDELVEKWFGAASE